MNPHYVLLIHGIGSAKERFSGTFEEMVIEVFETQVTRILGQPHAERPDIREVVWSPATQTIQNDLWRQLFPNFGRGSTLAWWSWLTKPSTWIDRARYWAPLREFVVSYLGDAVAYDEPPGTTKYGDIHRCVWAVIDACAANAVQNRATAQQPASLTIVAHSLGSVIASDLFADAIDRSRPGHSKPWPPQLQLTNFVTLGSPLALYSVQFNNLDEFPAISMQNKEHGLWINVYDPQDVLGYPLRPLNKKYAGAVFADKIINAGQWWNPFHALKHWNPLSHTLYWEDTTVAEIVGRKVALDWLRENHPELGARVQQEYVAYKTWVSG